MARSLKNNPRRRPKSAAEKDPQTTTNNKAPVILYVIIAVLLLSTIALFTWFLMNRPASTSSVQANIEKVADVVSHEPINGSTMHAWYVKMKETGQPALFYTTADGKTMAGGTLWDTKTGEPITAELARKMLEDNPELMGEAETTEAPSAPSQAIAGLESLTAQNDKTPGQAIGEYEGEVPLFLKSLDVLRGFKEDSDAAIEDTIYVVYDPRCPYCHKLYDATRNIDMEAKGVTIKWLPTVALGIQSNQDPAIGQAAFALEADSLKEFGDSFTNKGQSPATADEVTEDHFKALDANLSLLYVTANQAFPGQQSVAVPAVFYLDKRDGSPKMVYGAQDPEILKSIFGE